MEMFNLGKIHEVEVFAKNAITQDLSLDQFATISGVRGKQFGKEVFSTVIKFKDLIAFLTVFPDVQRELVNSKVFSIKQYTLTGLRKEPAMRFFPGLTVTARGHIFYDENTNRIAIDTRKSKLSINDGQHRFMGIGGAIEELKNSIKHEKDEEVKFVLRSELKELEEMVVPIVIFSNLTAEEERQLFHDTNNLAQRPSRSATINLAQTDLFSRLAREVSNDNRYLQYLGVERNKMSIQEGNENSVLLTTVYEMVKRLNWHMTQKKTPTPLTEENFNEVKEHTSATLDTMFFNLPPDLNTRNKYLTDRNYTYKAISRFIYDCRVVNIPEDVIFDTIKSINWTMDIEYWGKYRGFLSKNGTLTFGQSGAQSIVAIYDCLIDNLPKKYVKNN